MKHLSAAATLAILFMGIAFISSQGFRQMARADHDGVIAPYVPVLSTLYTTGDLGFGKAVPAPLDNDGFRKGIPAIMRSLTTGDRGAAREPIAVCSDPAFTSEVRDAVAMWNDGLSSAWTGMELTLEFHEGTAPDNCPRNDYHWQPSSISIKSGNDNMVAITDAELIRGDPWFTYAGTTTITLHSKYDDLPDRKKVAAIAHEIGHALGFRHPYEPIIRVKNAGTGYTGFTWWAITGCPGSLEYTRLADNGQPVDGSTVTDTDDITNISTRMKNLLDNISTTRHAGALMLPYLVCVGDTEESTDSWTYENAPALKHHDTESYLTGYEPSRVDDLQVGVAFTAGSLLLSWDADDVHVEKDLEMQVKVQFSDTIPGVGVVDTLGWQTVETATANTESIEMGWPEDDVSAVRPYRVVHPNGAYATYRVVSTTDAFGSRAPTSYSTSAEVTHEVDSSYTVATHTPTTVIAGATGGVTSTVQWYATITCQNGLSFTIGPAATAAQINADAFFALIACYATQSQRASLDFSSTLTRAQIERALQGVSHREPEMARTVSVPSAARGGGFSISGDNAGRHAVISCHNGTTFTIGPAETQVELTRDALFALTVCANAEELSELDLSETLTRDELEAAMREALAPSRSLAQLRPAPQGTETLGSAKTRDDGHGFTISSVTVYTWSGTCRVGGASGSGSATTSTAANAAFNAFSSSCPTQVVTGTTTWRYDARVMCWGGEVKTRALAGHDNRNAAVEAAEAWIGSACD